MMNRKLKFIACCQAGSTVFAHATIVGQARRDRGSILSATLLAMALKVACFLIKVVLQFIFRGASGHVMAHPLEGTPGRLLIGPD